MEFAFNNLVRDVIAAGKIDYKALADRTKAPDHFVSGTTQAMELIRKHCVLIK
ncbi:MAG: hypothetical protein U9N32_03380 [Spirochaetota bacterium]|nr:hypothetical protein [Spirochaetota bacterium]